MIIISDHWYEWKGTYLVMFSVELLGNTSDSTSVSWNKLKKKTLNQVNWGKRSCFGDWNKE